MKLDNAYEDLFNYSVDLLCINGLDGYFQLVNPAFEKLLGYTAEEFKSHHFLEYIHPDDLPATYIEMEKRKKGEHTHRFENRYKRKDGTYVWLEWTSFPVLEKGVMYAVGHDITARKEAEEYRARLHKEQVARQEAEKGIRLRDEFIAIASHELKTPLTALKIHFQIIPILMKKISFSGKNKFLSLFENSLKQLDNFEKLVDELLDVTKINSGQMALEKQKTNFSNLVISILKKYDSDLKKAGCEVKLNLEPSLEGFWDPIQLEQVIVNLLTNAMKYGAENPITIQSEKIGNKLRFSVKDLGIGIEEKNYEKIFQRFERLSPITRQRGFGLGLYITRQIVMAHGGCITIESELGKGSSFIVELPFF